MRTKDIAGLAGVTPRTLRHYHQIGLLPEPFRDRNGYRRYDVPALIRLLRIKGLAAAGVALGDMASFLEGRGAPAGGLLDALDAQLLDQIGQLERQRELVAQLRTDADGPGLGFDPALPFKALTEGRSEAANDAWREQLTLFSHLLSREDLAKLYGIYERLAQESEEFLALGKKFDALGPDSDAKYIDEMAREYAKCFESIFSDFIDMLAAPEKRKIFKIVHAHTMAGLNASQRKTLSAVASYMG